MNATNANLRPSARRPPPRGFTLIEVLVSLLIFSFGVLGLVGMQAKAIQFGVQSEDRMRASLLADEMVASMWANQSTAPGTATLTAWQQRVASALPSGTGAVGAADSSGVVTVTITWRPPSRDSTSPANSYLTQVAMP